MIYNYRYLKTHHFYSFWSWIRLPIFIFSLLGIYFVISGTALKVVFLILSAAAFYLLQSRILIASEQLLYLETLISYFGFSLFIFGSNFYLLPKNSLTLIALGFITFLIARSSFDYVPQERSTKNFYAWFLSFCVLEVSWTLLFLPLHFSVLAVTLFNIFYVLWIVMYYHMYHNLNSKKVFFHIVFSLILIALTFISTPWKTYI